MPRLTVPAIGLASLALLVALYAEDPNTYQKVMTAIIKVPFSYPFVDWEWIPSSVECWHKGVDVYLNNTCYAAWPNAGFNYSPLWLRLTFLRFADGWTNLFGLLLAVLFFLSLALLPPPRTRSDLAITVLATLSCATALAVERANTDLLMLLIIIVSVWACRLWMPLRLAAYAFITLAGLLKFYPMVALIVALRERPLVVTGIALSAGGALAALALFYQGEIVRMAANLPAASFFTLQFSATDLPGGLGVIASKILTKGLHQGMTFARAVDGLVYNGLLLLLTVQAVVLGSWFERRCQLRSTLTQLSASHSDLLVVGAALVCGCFFFSHAVIYKGIFLLLAIPGLLALSHQSSLPPANTAFRSTSIAVVFVLWFVFFEWCVGALGLGRPPRYMVDDGQAGPAGYFLWLCNELAWWWIVTVLIAVLLAFVLNSPLWAIWARTSQQFVRWRLGRRHPYRA